MRITNKLRFFKCIFLILLVFPTFSITSSCQTKSQTAEEIVKACQAFLDKDDLTGASKCVEKAIFDNPQKAEEISRLSTEAIFQKCHYFRNREDYKQAIICYEGATELMPESANVQFNLADSYYNYAKGRTIKDFEMLNRAEAAIKLGLERKPNDATAYSLYGDILQEKGQLEASILKHKKAVEIEPNTGIFWIKLAFVQEKANRNEDAIKSYQQAIIAEPNDTGGLFFLSRLYEKLGKYDEAIETIEKMNKIEPPVQEILDKLKELKEKQNHRKSMKAKTKGA